MWRDCLEIRRLMRRHQVDENLAAAVMDIWCRLTGKFNAGRYDLAPRLSDQKVLAATKSLEKVVGRTITELKTVSLDTLFSSRDETVIAAYDDLAERGLLESLAGGQNYVRADKAAKKAGLGLVELMLDHVRPTMGPTSALTLQHTFGNSFGSAYKDAFLTALTYHLVSVLTGDLVGAVTYGDLLNVMAEALPLGHAPDNPGAWSILIA